MSKYQILILALIFAHLPIYAKWIWTPQDGWINTQYNNKGQAKKLLENGKNFLKSGNNAAARESFEAAWKYFPKTKEGKEAVILLAEMKSKSGDKYSANQDYDNFLKANPSSSRIQDIAEKQYEIGSAIIRGESSSSPGRGVEVLRGVITRVPHADFADDAQMTIANYYYKKKMYEEAKVEYIELIKKYKQSEWLSRAKYLKALCHYKQYKGIELDGTSLQSAKKEIDDYVKKYEDSNEFEAAKKTQDDIVEKLAEKEIFVAEFYIRRGKNDSARIYLHFILRKYPRTRSAQKAKLLLKRIAKN
ncbi:outer membrane protein assembly factor BamD [Candidatus Uabimicrobium sp. HlEnr_7]|uniref:outer membrane protein assembly factor BamD n=1 Tax=Candidatus Uabimicrobium helgolandensis TaxID=3095367 RepID=UPI003558DDB7